MNRTLGALAAGALLAGLTACSGGNYVDTPLPDTGATAAPSASATAPPSPPSGGCDNATQSYDPLGSIPSTDSIDDTAMQEIIDRGYLRVGVSADSYLLGAYNPLNAAIEGFDIDIAKAVAKAIFGDENDIRLVVITAGQRLSSLTEGTVDMVARNMTMNCERWEQIAFSSEYYHAGQKVLVTRNTENDKPSTLALRALTGKRVCAPNNTTSLTKLEAVNDEVGGIDIVTSNNHTGCLVLFQQGQVDAITGDDTVLAGLAAQDPYAQVTTAEAITDEPYGLGIAQENVYFVRYVNAVLEKLRSDGEWKTIYNRWFAASLGKAPNPPVPVYGRS